MKKNTEKTENKNKSILSFVSDAKKGKYGKNLSQANFTSLKINTPQVQKNSYIYGIK